MLKLNVETKLLDFGKLCKTLTVICYGVRSVLRYAILCYEFCCPTKATKSGITASEIGLRAIFHFGNGSVNV